MASRRHYHTPSSKHWKPNMKRDPCGFVIAILEQAAAEIRIGNFVRAHGLLASQLGTLKELAFAANQRISPADKPLKAARQRNGCARGGRDLPAMRVPLGELLRNREDTTPAGRWPPASVFAYAGEDDDMGGTKPSDPDDGADDE